MTFLNIRQNSIQCSGHTRPVVDLKFSQLTSDGSYYLITASKDGLPMLRFGHTGDWIGTFRGHKGAVWSCTLNNNGSEAATGAADFTAKIWDCETGTTSKTINHDHIVRSVDFNDEASILVTANNKCAIALHDLNASNSKIKNLVGHTDIIRKCIWLENNKTIISVSLDKTLRIWDIRSNSELFTMTLPNKIYDINIVDNRIILATDGGISIGSISDVNEPVEFLKFIENKSKVLTASLMPSIKSNYINSLTDSFICGTEDSHVYKYDVNTNKLLDICKGHFGPVHCARFSPDGHLFASGSEDGTIRLWQNCIGENYGLWYLSKVDNKI